MRRGALVIQAHNKGLSQGVTKLLEYLNISKSTFLSIFNLKSEINNENDFFVEKMELFASKCTKKSTD